VPVDPPKIHAIQSKFAQLLAETIIGVAPHVQEHVQAARADANHDFLEGMEQHVANLVSPILASVAASGTIPPELRPLLTELGVPTEQFTGIISQFFVFGIMFTLAQAMLAPFVQQVQNDVWSSNPDRPLSPPDIATAVVRGIGFGDSEGTEIPAWAIALAAESGFDADTFTTMVGVTGMAPSLQLLYEMIRRGVIEEGSLNGGGTTLYSGVQQSDVKDEWIPSIAKLRYAPPSPTDLVAAAVRHQTDELPDGADLSYWEQLAESLGLEPPGWINDNPNWFNMLYNISGRPLGPQEMGRLANRGQIPWSGLGSAEVTFQQGIAESDIKDKWEAAAVLLEQYWPAVGEIGSLLREGGLSVDQAATYWAAEGVPDELHKALLYVSQIQQVTQDRALAKGDIETLLQENAISDDDALEMLAEVGYSGTNAAFLVEMAHFRYELEALRTSVRTISTLYVGRKITATEAQSGLQGLGMPATQIATLLDTLTYQRQAEVVIPTASQIASALYYGVITSAAAMSKLENLGYSAADAWLVLSVRMHGPITPAPAGVTIPSSSSTTPVVTGTGGPTGVGAIVQSLPETNSVLLADIATFSDQLVPTSYNESPVTYVTTTTSPFVNVDQSGKVTASGTPALGAVYVAGTMSDAVGDTGTWSYTLTFE
jgi:hypothetical protein